MDLTVEVFTFGLDTGLVVASAHIIFVENKELHTLFPTMTKPIDITRDNGSVEAMFRGMCERAASRAPQQFVAVETFTRSQESMLSFQKGDIITASRNQQHIDWWFGYCKGEIGWFPTHCVQSQCAAVSHNNHGRLSNDNQNAAGSVEQQLKRPLQQKRPEINKMLHRIKQTTLDGARNALLAVVGAEDDACTLPSQSQQTHRTATNNKTNASSGAVSKQNKTTLQLAMEQEYATNVELPIRTATVSPTCQVRLYSLQTQLPANLQQRRDQLGMSENHDQQTVSSSSVSSSSSSSGAGKESIQTVPQVAHSPKIVGMEVSY